MKMTGKKKWTLIDTLIVIVVAVAAFAVVKTFGKSTLKGESKTIDAVVLIAKEDQYVGEAIKAGDTITVSLTEKDTGVLKDVRIEDAVTMVYNSIDGVYQTETVEGKVDIYATVELEVTENDYAFATGSTVVKVGEKMPFRSKGYALEGFIIEIDERD